ncbi:hypothetical protein [Actinomadura sp. HBU206391]|uniref:hypothetical protein n=1 Tax=Actinomadura sp. HBU206391 TaxID=2731692 RepID=UPI00164F820C|nr:hypothetical protein [Actinomadura sp. HBU206391]MBC6458235.1 hypothetical protein [Actinomadura sp. HBU206391]
MHARPSWEPPRLYSWTLLSIGSGAPHVGALGVTDDRARALRRAGEALSDTGH